MPLVCGRGPTPWVSAFQARCLEDMAECVPPLSHDVDLLRRVFEPDGAARELHDLTGMAAAGASLPLLLLAAVPSPPVWYERGIIPRQAGLVAVSFERGERRWQRSRS